MNPELKGNTEGYDAPRARQTGPEEKLETASTRYVLDRHLKCFGQFDLDGILSDYAPDAVMFTEKGPLRGVEAIRPLFQALIAEFEKPGAAFSMKLQSVEGDCGYILWNAETSENVYELGTDTFVVRQGKIVAQSFTTKITTKC
jgi:ketosteroid isomerase-like protein